MPLELSHQQLDLLLVVEQTTNGEVEQVALTTTKLGGQLEPFADVTKGYRLAKPLGWNRYDGVSGEYVVKMVDLVDPTQVILLTSSPVKSETQVRVSACAVPSATRKGKLCGFMCTLAPRVGCRPSIMIHQVAS